MNKLLIVDDDAEVRRGYRALLEAHGYEIASAADGVSAVREALAHEPDLVVLDLGLPSGTGFDVLKWLRSTRLLARIPVIVVSGMRIDVEQMALSLGATVYLHKPANDAELLALIRRLLTPDEHKEKKNNG